MRSEFTTDLPSELSWIPEFSNIEEVKDWLLKKALVWHLRKYRIVPKLPIMNLYFGHQNFLSDW